MSKRNRTRRSARKKPFRQPKPTILIVTEGKKTEPQYFRGFANTCKNPRVTIEVIPCGGVPLTVVEKAKELMKAAQNRAKKQSDENLAYDEVWCVFDRDDHPHVSGSLQMARDNQIEVAFSNPCFELWLLLHFQDQPGMQDRNDIQRLLKNHLPNLDKNIQFEDFHQGYADALRRAKQLDAEAERDGEPDRNPTTGVWRLTLKISEDSSEFTTN